MQVASTYHRGGTITISRSAFPYTQALNINSTRSYLDPTAGSFQRTEPFRPGNMHYLSTLIYECTRHWQWAYDRRADYRHGYGSRHHFTKEQLQAENRPALSGERHASAAQVFFLIEWQIRYKGGLVDLTSAPQDSEFYVGPVDRYDEIAVKEHDENGRRIVKNERAKKLNSAFNWYLYELRNPGPRERYACAESTQRSRVTSRNQFFQPRPRR